jgi:hypothetical protein
MKINTNKIKNKILALLSLVFIFSNQAMSMDDNADDKISKLSQIGRGLSQEVSNEINNLIKVGGGLIEVSTIVKSHEKSVLNENEKSIIENFFGNKNRFLPDNLGLINNIWKTERMQSNQFNLLSYNVESSGETQALLNRLYRFKYEEEKEDVLKYHIAVVKASYDIIQKIKNIHHIYDSIILIDHVRVSNIKWLDVHGGYLKQQYPDKYGNEVLERYHQNETNILLIEGF